MTFTSILSLILTLVLASGNAKTPAQDDYTVPFPAFRIADNLYYVGTRGVASYLITTPQGHILINSNVEAGIPLLRASVESLGFKFGDIKTLLISHAHWDHVAGSATIKKLTGAKYMVMEGDVPVVQSGGKSDFQYGSDPSTHYPPTSVDRVLRDGDEVKLGDAVLTAHLTPGHTKGCTTWTLKVKDGARTRDVVIIGSPNVNPGYKLVDNKVYPGMAQDFERTFTVLKSLPRDYFLGAHGSYFDLETKYARMKAGSATAFIDPEGYKNYVAEREQAFRRELAKQTREGANAQAIDFSTVNLAFEKQIPAWLNETNVPAVGIGIIEDGKLRYAKVFGELKKGASTDVSPSTTIFQVASLTKPIVEILTLQLVTAGEWNLDEPLAKYWIDPDVQNDPRHEKLTTRHVLTHQSGFPNWRSMTASKKLEFLSDPGTKVNYSGEGLEYLRRALEKKFNEPLDRLAQNRLFQPYGMKHTRFFWDASMDESKFAVAHNAEGKPYDIHKHTTANAADLLLTTIDDYSKFAINVLDRKGLSQAVFDDMIRPQVSNPGGKNLFFGLGWMIMPDLSNGEYALIHTGRDPGVSTVVILFPKSRRGLIVFTNGDNGVKVWTRILAEAFDVGKEMLQRA